MKLITLMLAAAAVMLCCVLPLHAAGFTTLKVSDLKAMLDRKQIGLLVLDSRPVSQFDESHIPGAVSLPLDVMEKKPQLPKAPKDAMLVFYCSGST